MSLSIQVRGLDKLMKSFSKAPQIIAPVLTTATKKAGAVVVTREKKEAPVNTGNLRRSVEIDYNPIQVKITPKARYAQFVNNGTGLFGETRRYIRPVTAKALKFKGKSGIIFTRRVKGQKPNPFVERTVKGTKSEVNNIFDKALEEIINIL